MKRISLLIAASLTLWTSAAAAQDERVSGGAPTQSYRAGWTITPTMGVGETFDDNISLFGINTAEQQNNDVIASYFPEIDVHFVGKHTTFGSGYSGSFLDYRTYSALNRWDQRANLELRRDESAQVKWFARANAAALPSTDLVDLGGIPYRRSGAQTADGRVGLEYVLSERDAISETGSFQSVQFDRSPLQPSFELRGGRVFEALTAWRHKLSSRLAVGSDYSYRLASVVGDPETFTLHSTQAALDYELSALWAMSGAVGVVYQQATPTLDGHLGPAYRISLQRHRAGRVFHVGYLRSFIPSFGFGGTVENQSASIGYRTPIFGSRHVYLDGSAVYRADDPLTNPATQLPLHSFRTYAILGWQPQPWVRLEGFYVRVQQTSTRVGGEIFRNRIGFQIVTSKPMRID